MGALPLLGLLLYTLLLWKKKTKARVGDPALVGQLDDGLEQVELVCTGPWPPYSFCEETPE